MKKLINSSLLALCVLFGTSKADAMLKKCLAGVGIVGIGTAAGILCKKYFYDPLMMQKKYKKYLAPQDVQKLSNHLLDAHLKTGKGGLRKRLRIKYLKTFGYNNVHVMDLDKFPESTAKDAIGLAYHKGGIFIIPHIAQNRKTLVSTLGHETAHLYRGDATHLKSKFRISSMIAYLGFYLIKNLLKERNLQKGVVAWGDEITSINKKDRTEFLTCKKNIKTLFYAGHFGPLVSVVKKTISAPGPYTDGRLEGLQEVIDENPKHPLITKFIPFNAALKSGNKKKLERTERELETAILKNKKNKLTN